MKITANDGTNMEGNPRPVDVEVRRPIGETLTDRDSQLDAATLTMGGLGRAVEKIARIVSC